MHDEFWHSNICITVIGASKMTPYVQQNLHNSKLVKFAARTSLCCMRSSSWSIRCLSTSRRIVVILSWSSHSSDRQRTECSPVYSIYDWYQNTHKYRLQLIVRRDVLYTQCNSNVVMSRDCNTPSIRAIYRRRYKLDMSPRHLVTVLVVDDDPIPMHMPYHLNKYH